MIKLITAMVEIEVKDMVGNINTAIFNKVVEKYTNKCFDEKLIKKVVKIEKRSVIEACRNTFPAIFYCDVVFSAICVEYNRGDLLLIKITKKEENHVIAESDNYVAYLEVTKKSASIFKIEVGYYLIVCIVESLLNTGKKISLKVIMFNKPARMQVTRIVDKSENETTSKAIKLCTDNIKKILDGKISHVLEIFHNKTVNKSKLPAKNIFAVKGGKNKNIKGDKYKSIKGGDDNKSDKGGKEDEEDHNIDNNLKDLKDDDNDDEFDPNVNEVSDSEIRNRTNESVPEKRDNSEEKIIAVQKNESVDEVYFIINPYDHIEDGKYYIAKDLNMLDNKNVIVKTEAISLEYKIMKYCTSINNYMEVMQEISNLSEEEFANNKPVWNYYKNT